MQNRIKKCVKGWSAGVFIMCFPLVFLYPEFSFGKEVWKMLFSVVLVFMPVLLLFEFALRRQFLHSVFLQTSILSVLLILTEIELVYLPFRFTQLLFLGNFFSGLICFLFAIIAAYVIQQILSKHKKVVIIQKEI